MTLPPWLKIELPKTNSYNRVNNVLVNTNLNTVCQEAACPNQAECWDQGTATFLIMGDTCTRNCLYCNVSSGKPSELDPNEPSKVALAVQKLGLKYIVLTSVTRDDLSDGGDKHFAKCIKEIKKNNPNCKIEILIPDLDSLDNIHEAKPDVINHNIEATQSVFAKVRPQGDYQKSLNILRKISFKGFISKSGMMVGFGESWEDVISTLQDLKKSNVQILTIGQYLQPSKKNIPVNKYYTPEEFIILKKYALDMGFISVESGHFVRSSYNALQNYLNIIAN